MWGYSKVSFLPPPLEIGAISVKHANTDQYDPALPFEQPCVACLVLHTAELNGAALLTEYRV